ncbi:MAG: tetratricopeptide repeat protein [Pseudomonadota bacterium]
MSTDQTADKAGRKGAKRDAAKKKGGGAPAGRDETDIFIAEVTEELQRDRAYKLFRRYGPFVAAAVVLIVIAAAVNEYMNASATQAAREAGAAIFEAVEGEDLDASIAALTAKADDLSPGAAIVARLNAAALAAQNGDEAQAAALFDRVAADAEPQSPYRDLGLLRAAMMRFDAAPASESIAAFEPLTAQGRPFRALALEMLGAAHVKAGDLAAARDAFRAAFEEPLAPQSLRVRAADLLVGAGGADPRLDEPEARLGDSPTADGGDQGGDG